MTEDLHTRLLMQAQMQLLRIEREQRQQSAMHRAVLDALPAHVALLDENGVILSVNASWRGFAAANGMRCSSAGVGQNYPALCDAVIGPEAADAQRAASGIRTVLCGSALHASLEYPCHAPTVQRWFRMTVTPLCVNAAGIAVDGDGSGEVRGAVVMHMDISERKRAEGETRRSAKLLHAVAASMPDAIFVKDVEGRYLFCNDAAARGFGTTVERMLGRDDVFLLGPDAAVAPMRTDRITMQTGLAHSSEGVLNGSAGPWNFLVTKVPYRGEHGAVIGVIGISRDVSERKRGEQAVRELAERLSTTLESLSDGFCALDPDWRISYLNGKAERMLGRPRTEALGRLLWQQVPEVVGSPFETALRRAMNERTTVQLVEHFAPLGRWYEARIFPSEQGLAVYLRDVSLQHTLATQLAAERSRLIAAQMVGKIGSWTTDLVSFAIEWSEQTHCIFETDASQFTPTYAGFLERVHADDRAALNELFQRTLGQDTTQFFEHRLLLPSGADKVVEERWQVFRDDKGTPLRAVGTCQDITERKHTEQALYRSQALLGMAGRLARVGGWSVDLPANRVICSDMLSAIHDEAPGFSPSIEEALGYYAPEHLDMMKAAFEACVTEGTPFDVEHQIITAHGRRVWVRAIGEAVRDERGVIGRVQGALQDVSERKQAEQHTRALTARLSNTLESITDGFFTLDRGWRYTYLNREAERALGRRREDLIGHNVWEVYPEALGTEFDRGYHRAMNGERGVTFEALYAPWNAWISVNCYPSDEGLSVYFRDVTVARATRLQLELLEASVSKLNDMMVITEAAPLDDPGPRILFVNDAFVRITGHTREEVLGKTPRLMQGDATNRAELDRMRVALSAFEPVHAELLNYKKGGEPYWVEIDIVPVGVAGTANAHFVAVQRDITSRRRDQDALRELNADLEHRVLARTAELNQARQEAEQANHAKSSFLATMSHEIRTPMNGVIGMIDVLRQSSLHGHQIEMVDLIRDSAFSLLDIVDDILDFSKIEAGAMSLTAEPMQLEDVVEKVCAMLNPMAVKRGIRLTTFVDPAIPHTILADALRLRQVLVNLTGNAIKFSSGTDRPGQVSVRAEWVEREADSVTVDLVVADNGIGIDAATLARLFVPFSQADASTTRRFGGTGLGLAISSTLVQLMGGHIDVRSEPGQGSTFRVRFRFPVDGAGADGGGERPVAAVGLRCRIVGSELPLADNLATYLRHVGASVEHSPDLPAAACAHQAAGLWLWLILPAEDVPALPALRAMAPGRPRAETRFIVLKNGKRRQPRVEAVDLVSVDGNLLSCRALVDVLALASGRVPLPASSVDPSAPAPLSAASTVSASGVAAALDTVPADSRAGLILVAEDNETNRKVIMLQLQLIGFAAEVVVNGREALRRWRSGRYALLLTDLHMPEMDGYALARAIRTEEAGARRMPIIAVTANALRDEAMRCAAAGMDAHLTKPVRLEHLRAAIERWLGTAAVLPPVAQPLPGAPATALPMSMPVPAATSTARPNVAASPPSAGTDVPVDLRVLVTLVGDDPAVIADMLRSFRKSADRSYTELAQATSGGAVRTAGDAAHRLRSGASSVGALRLSVICGEIEQLVETGGADVPGALGMLQARFEDELAAVYGFLDSTQASQHKSPGVHG